jgi:hypothetical protein
MKKLPGLRVIYEVNCLILGDIPIFHEFFELFFILRKSLKVLYEVLSNLCVHKLKVWLALRVLANKHYALQH